MSTDQTYNYILLMIMQSRG